MEYERGHYRRAVACCRRKESYKTNKAAGDEPPPYKEYARKVINRAYFIILNKIDELDGTNERLLKYYNENIEKNGKV